MTAPKLQQTSEFARPSGLDLIVKYAVLLSWFVYGAGLTKISGFLRTLGVPTEPSTYALTTVLSYGAYSLLEILKITAFPIIFLKLFEKQTPRQLWWFIGWTMPAVIFLLRDSGLFGSIGPLPKRIYYPLSSLGAPSILLYLFNASKIRDPSAGIHVLRP